MKPGRLSVSRTFGDIEAKVPTFGGNPNVVISTPEIVEFELSDDHDFILIGCDGVFDKISNNMLIKRVWSTVIENQFDKNLHRMTGH